MERFNHLKQIVNTHLKGEESKCCIPLAKETSTIAEWLLNINLTPEILTWQSQTTIINDELKQRAWLDIIVLNTHRESIISRLNKTELLDNHIMIVCQNHRKFYLIGNNDKFQKLIIGPFITMAQMFVHSLQQWHVSSIYILKDSHYYILAGLDVMDKKLYTELINDVALIRIIEIDFNGKLFKIVSNLLNEN